MDHGMLSGLADDDHTQYYMSKNCMKMLYSDILKSKHRVSCNKDSAGSYGIRIHVLLRVIRSYILNDKEICGWSGGMYNV